MSESDSIHSSDAHSTQPPPLPEEVQPPRRFIWRRKRKNLPVLIPIVLVTYLLGLGSGYGIWGNRPVEASQEDHGSSEMAALMEQINPSKGYRLPIRYGDLGPQMVAGGVFDAAQFAQVYQQAGQPLDEQQQAILTQGSDEPVVISRNNAYFLLNFFWAVGLSNKNPILDSGPIQERK